MFNVLHLIDTYETGGAETVYAQIVEGLDRSRFHSIPVLLGEGWLARRVRAAGFEPVIIPTSGSFDLGFVRRLTDFIKSQRVDLVHAHLLTSAVYGSLAARRARVPLVASFHGTMDVSARFLRAKTAIVNRGARHIVFVSETLRREILDRARLRPDLTRVVHNGVDPSRFVVGRDTTWRRTLGIADDALVVGGIGRATAVKAFPVLLRAIAELRSTDPRFVGLIVGAEDPDGDRSEHQRLLALRDELGLRDAVHFVGFQDEMPRVMASLDLLAVTSRSEGFSLTTIEAMATGVPVVSTRCGGPEEIITDGRDGLLIGVDDVAALAGAIRRIATDGTLRAGLVRAGRDTAESRFSLARSARGYERLYRTMLPQQRLTPAGNGMRKVTPRSSAAVTVKRTARSVLGSSLLAPLWRPFTTASVTVLMLHRFEDPERGVEGHDPLQLAAHLEWLRANRFVLSSLPDLAARFAAGKPALPGTVVFTVDDGYADFARVGAPVFERYDCPVTTFLVTGFISGACWLWYDAVEHAFGRAERDAFDLTVGEVTTRVTWASAAERRARLFAIVEYLKSRPSRDVDAAVRALAKSRGFDFDGPPPTEFAPMSWDDARRCEAGVVTFGPHSHRHPILARTDDLRAADEVTAAWRTIRAELHRPAPIFCYPNGRPEDFGQRERDLVRDAGLLAAVAAEGGHCSRADFEADRFALPRLAYPDEPAAFRKVVGGLERLNLLLRNRRRA